jgi:hypothetical protein
MTYDANASTVALEFEHLQSQQRGRLLLRTTTRRGDASWEID